MKRLQRRVAALFFLGCAFAYANARIDWRMHDIDGAYAEARKKNALVMIDVYTDWCVWCHALDTNAYANATVINAAKAVIPLKINPEASLDEMVFAQEFGVEGFPTILFTDGNGALFGRVVGYVEAPALLAQMKKAQERMRALPQLKKSAGQGAAKALVELVDFYLSTGQLDEAIPYVDAALTKAPASKKPELYARLMEAYYLDDDILKAKEYADCIISEYPKSEYLFDAIVMNAQLLADKGSRSEASAYLEEASKNKNLSVEWRERFSAIARSLRY